MLLYVSCISFKSLCGCYSDADTKAVDSVWFILEHSLRPWQEGGASNAALERRFFILVYESHTDLNFLSTSSFLSAVTSFRGSVGRRWTQSLPPMSSRRHRHLFACVNERLIINGFVRRGSFMLPTYYLHGLQWRVLQDSRLVWSSPPVWNPKSQTPCPQIWKLPTKQLFTHFKKIFLKQSRL